MKIKQSKKKVEQFYEIHAKWINETVYKQLASLFVMLRDPPQFVTESLNLPWVKFSFSFDKPIFWIQILY